MRTFWGGFGIAHFLVIAEAYASQAQPYALAFIHTRVKEYQRLGHRISVLSFRAETDYEFDGVTVLSSKKDWPAFLKGVDFCISHAPNVRNHMRFLWRYRKSIPKLTLVFHGHEVMNLRRELPAPFAWNKTAKFRGIVHIFYDPFKQFAMRRFVNAFQKRGDLKLIFVSSFMKRIFERNIFACGDITNRVINNPVGAHFLDRGYSKETCEGPLKALCLRPFDVSKYGVDLVVGLAQKNPDVIVDIFGKGEIPAWFEENANVNFHRKFFSQADIPTLLNDYDVAVMPTRWDSQGVSVCEFAKFGIPLITSDIPVMREMVEDFANVTFLKNADFNVKIDAGLLSTLRPNSDDLTRDKFSPTAIARSELAFISN